MSLFASMKQKVSEVHGKTQAQEGIPENTGLVKASCDFSDVLIKLIKQLSESMCAHIDTQ